LGRGAVGVCGCGVVGGGGGGLGRRGSIGRRWLFGVVRFVGGGVVVCGGVWYPSIPHPHSNHPSQKVHPFPDELGVGFFFGADLLLGNGMGFVHIFFVVRRGFFTQNQKMWKGVSPPRPPPPPDPTSVPPPPPPPHPPLPHHIKTNLLPLTPRAKRVTAKPERKVERENKEWGWNKDIAYIL